MVVRFEAGGYWARAKERKRDTKKRRCMIVHSCFVVNRYKKGAEKMGRLEG